jgi:hypothetical protein
LTRRANQRHDSIIAQFAGRRIRDLASAVLTVAERSTQMRDVNANAAFLDRYARPDLCEQRAIADDIACILDQDGKDSKARLLISTAAG